MRTMERGVAALVAALVAISPAPRANAAQWHEARIADFVLVTDGKEEYARRTLREFAVFKQALGALAPLTRTVPRMPTQVFALDSGTWRSFAPSRQIAAEDPDRCVLIDASASPETVAAQVWTALRDHLFAMATSSA